MHFSRVDQRRAVFGQVTLPRTIDQSGRAMSESIRVNAKRFASRNIFFATMILVTLVCWWHSVVQLLALAFRIEQYSHVLLVLPVSVLLALLEYRTKGLRSNWSPLPALVVILASLSVLVTTQLGLRPGSQGELIVGVGSLVLIWIGLVMFFYGVETVRQLLFPLLFLFLIVPIPQFVVDKSVVALQVASSDATYTLFRWSGMPVLRNAFVLSMPGLDIEVAQQCSGIRSALILVISCLVLGQLYLRSWWSRVLLVLAAIPIAIAKNAIRIFTLSMLGIKVDSAFLYGRLHRNGGIVFFILALAAIALLIKLLRRTESWANKPLVRPQVARRLSSFKTSTL